jgi:hypothetical protein
MLNQCPINNCPKWYQKPKYMEPLLLPQLFRHILPYV